MMMNTTQFLHVLVVTFLLCMKTSSSSSESLSKDSNSTTRCIEREREALLVFKQGGVVAARGHDVFHSWENEQEDCCKWKGVGCDNRTGHVTHLHLSSLISPIYTSSPSVNINNAFLDLPYLKYLDLSSNFIAGIPEFIGSLTNLVHLDFSQTWIGGPIPNQIGNLSNLQYLNLSFNGFNGSIPKFIGSLNSLRYLDLSYCYSSIGVIPRELGNLSKLQHLDLGHNYDNYGITGGENLEWLFNLSSLVYLDLSYINMVDSSIWVSFIQRIHSISVMRLNFFNLLSPSSTLDNISSSISAIHLRRNYINSSIFDWLPRWSASLGDLDLGYNMIEGRMPESFGHMTALTYLDLSGNQLNGVLPNSIRDLTNLKVVDFRANNFTGNLEDILFGPFPLLQELTVSENQLTGSLPDITLLSSLRKLEVSSNQLSGYLPPVFEHHSALQLLDLSENHLRGSLPDFTGFSSLESLYLYKNDFSGNLPHFTGLSSLRLLHLYNNEISGSVPDFTGCSSLQVLRLGENQLTEWGTQSTGLLSSLVELDLSKNSIRGTISEEHLSNLFSLKFLRTSFNSLTFKFISEWLPPFQLQELSLASCKLGPKFPNRIRNQEYIDHLDISNSQISDTIPIWFRNFSSLIHLNLSSNKIRGKFPYEIVYIQEIDLSINYFNGPLPPISVECLKINLCHNKFSGTLLSLSVVQDLSLRFIDISHNHLIGTLPENWMHFQGLVFLNLGYNNISGKIPPSIGYLVSLQTLIMRNNKLSGELPVSIRNCRNLGFVDFGLNELSGKVPSWIGEDLPQLYALILKSNRLYGSLPYEICHLSNLHFLDLSINKISGTIPPCFDNFTAMIHKGSEVAEHNYTSAAIDPSAAASVPTTSYSYLDNVLAQWKGQEFEYGRNFAYLKMIDLSTNKLTGEIPIGITRLLELRGLNLSGNGLSGKVPLEIDLSSNCFSGRIPSSTQLDGFNFSTFKGNSGLCGKPLISICPGDEPADLVEPSSVEYEVDGDDNEYKRWLYISAVLGFSTTFWGFIGTLVLKRRWRHIFPLSGEHERTILCCDSCANCQIAEEGLKLERMT